MIIVILHTSLLNLPDLYINAEVCLFVFFLFLLLQWFVVAWSHLLFTWFCLDICVNLDSSLLCDVLRLIIYVINPFFFGFITHSTTYSPTHYLTLQTHFSHYLTHSLHHSKPHSSCRLFRKNLVHLII